MVHPRGPPGSTLGPPQKVDPGAIHSTKISDRSDREKWSTSKGGPGVLTISQKNLSGVSKAEWKAIYQFTAELPYPLRFESKKGGECVWNREIGKW